MKKIYIRNLFQISQLGALRCTEVSAINGERIHWRAWKELKLTWKCSLKKPCMAELLWFPQTIADFSHRSRLKDNSFDSDGKHSDVYTKLVTSYSIELPWNLISAHQKERGTALAVSWEKGNENKEKDSRIFYSFSQLHYLQCSNYVIHINFMYLQ